jgi:hypothetical protein
VSPDNADALAITFGHPIEPTQHRGGPHRPHSGNVNVARGTSDDPYAGEGY